jgi:hypothetical protein
MESGLPEDLARVHDWASAAINAGSDLCQNASTKQTRSARARLIELLLDPPPISANLVRELTIASDHYQREDPASFSGIPARHPLDAVRELCWQILESSHRQSKAAIQLRIALHRGPSAMDAPTRSKYRRWVKAVAAIERVEENRAELKKILPKFDAVVKQFPASAQPLLDPGAPGPSQVLCPGDGLDVLLQKVLNRVWSDRLELLGRDQGGPGGAPPDSNLGTSKKRRPGRPQRGDVEKDARIHQRWNELRPRLHTFERFVRELGGGLTAKEAKLAVDRHRHWIKRRK